MMISLEIGRAQTAPHIKTVMSRILHMASYSVKMVE